VPPTVSVKRPVGERVDGVATLVPGLYRMAEWDHDRIVALLDEHGSLCFQSLSLSIGLPTAMLQAQVTGILGRSPDLLESGAGRCGVCREEARIILHRRKI
jgi:hypothetical protein